MLVYIGQNYSFISNSQYDGRKGMKSISQEFG